MSKIIVLFIILLLNLITIPLPLSAEEVTDPIVTLTKEIDLLKNELANTKNEANWIWTCIAAFMVFFMQAGFAYVEAGFTRAKNAVNILMKNINDFAIGSLAFWLIGFSFMFGVPMFASFGVGTPGTAETMINHPDGTPNPWGYAFFLFQLVFAGTSATIVSGAMAERTKFVSYVLFSVFITAIIYPIFGSLAWGGLWGGNRYSGFLQNLNIASVNGSPGANFIDFAGSTVVHSIGGWAGLAGAIVLGPRIGKFQQGGKVLPILGHNLSMSTLGVFILWFGWFGFNPGSTTSVNGGNFAIIAVTTNMAAVAGGVAALMTTWIVFRLPDIGLTLNGILAGLVAITSPCANVSITSAVFIGGAAGVLVVFSVLLLDKMRIDDPVGAVSVHAVCGMWGTFATGLFAEKAFGGVNGLFFGGGFSQVIAQTYGIIIAFIWSFGTSILFFLILKYTIGLRVTEDEEIQGLDYLEHGNEAYPNSR